jgi:TonB-linked SusC/RagA family outer membrane protein
MGKTAGVTISTNSGAPGNSSTIRIRGGASLNASNDPLIVIDGVPIENVEMGGAPNILSTINPADIENFTILKDASATAIYGSRASNGVILVTTKRGGRKLSINYKLTTSIYTIPKTVDVLSGDEFRSIMEEQYPGNQAVIDLMGEANTNWQNEIYQTAFGHDHVLSVSGQYKTVPMRLSVGYNNTDSTLKTYNFERTTINAGIDPSFLNDHLKFSLNSKLMNNNNNFADQDAIAGAVAYDPIQAVHNDNMRWLGYSTWTQNPIDKNSAGIDLATGNPVARLELTDNTSKVIRSISNAKVDYKFHFLPDLKATINVAYDFAHSEGHNNVHDSTQWVYIPIPGGGQFSEYEDTRENSLFDSYLSYNIELSELMSKVSAMAGYSWSHFYRHSNDSILDYAKTILSRKNDFETEYYNIGFFGRINYDFMERYLMTFTLRNDATSRFSPDNRWGLFPAGAFAWKINKEQFMASMANVSELKLRIGYGITGQQDIVSGNDYPYFAKYTRSDDASRYRFGNDFYYTLRPDGYDANIKWETTKTTNIGIDLGFYNDRITGSVDYYKRTTTDLIGFVPVASGTNFASSILTNVGSMENSGLELNVNTKIISQAEMVWQFGFNLSYNKNEITSLNLNNDPNYTVSTGLVQGTTSGTIQIHKVGYPINSFYVYEQLYDETGNIVEGEYVDRNDDGQVNSSDLYVYKKPAADFNIGLNTNYQYKNWNLGMSGRINMGNYVYNNVASNSTYANLYQPQNFLQNISSQAHDTKFQAPQYLSDYYIENGSFFKLDNISLGYAFNEILNNKLKLNVNFAIQNALVISGYKGLDPEINGGIDNNFYPRSRNFILGINVTF